MRSSIVLFISAQTGIERTHISRCCSVIPLPLVIKPPLIFMLLMNTCSNTRSVDSPHIFFHFSTVRGIQQLFSGTQQDVHSLDGPMQVQLRSVKVVIRSCQIGEHFRKSCTQCPVRSALINFLRMSTMPMYHNQSLALRLS